MRRAQRRYWRGALLLLGALTLAACGEDEQKAADSGPVSAPPPGVLVAPVAKAPITGSQSFTGRIEATDKVDIVARIEGYLEKRDFVEGAEVKVGDVLFEIEKDTYQAQVESARGSLQRAQAAAKLADIEVGRQTTLVRNQTTAQARLDEATAKKGDADGAVLQAQAALTEANLNLQYTTITAPIAGRISQAAVDPGALVTPQSGVLATVVSVDPMYATFPVSNRQLLQIRKEMAEKKVDAANAVVRLNLADGTDYAHPGKIDFVGVTASEGTDTVTVRAVFPNPERFLVDGQIAKVTVQAEKPEEALVVAQGAVLVDQQGAYVLTVKQDDTVQINRVQLGAATGASVAIVSGLAEGDRVIVDGVQKARPGQKVTPSLAPTAAEAKS
jgi:membrane fusion protein (multidrug efflux system)